MENLKAAREAIEREVKAIMAEGEIDCEIIGSPIKSSERYYLHKLDGLEFTCSAPLCKEDVFNALRIGLGKMSITLGTARIEDFAGPERCFKDFDVEVV